MVRDMVNRDDKTAGTETHYGWVEIPWFPASMPKLLSQRVYSALLVLDVSAPSEPGGTRWALGKTGCEQEKNQERESERGRVVVGGEGKEKWQLCDQHRKQDQKRNSSNNIKDSFVKEQIFVILLGN